MPAVSNSAFSSDSRIPLLNLFVRKKEGGERGRVGEGEREEEGRRERKKTSRALTLYHNKFTFIFLR